MSRRPTSSQELWTQAEALERAGKKKEAIDLLVKAASMEEDDRRPLRAKILWEQIAQRTGPSGVLLERLARVCARAQLEDDAFAYWVAATAQFRAEGKTEPAEKARAHATSLKRTLSLAADDLAALPELARTVIGTGEAVRDLTG
jgi:hypothetical protein